VDEVRQIREDCLRAKAMWSDELVRVTRWHRRWMVLFRACQLFLVVAAVSNVYAFVGDGDWWHIAAAAVQVPCYWLQNVNIARNRRTYAQTQKGCIAAISAYEEVVIECDKALDL
jgi:hypothetical protein